LSKIALSGNASGTGTLTIAAPNTNSDFTITLPAASGTLATTDTAGFPAGTVMLFVQTSAPTGWTKSTTHDNKALRVVSGTASSGGSAAFTTAFGTPSVSGSVSLSGTVGSTTLTTSQIPAHNHTVNAGPDSGSGASAISRGISTDVSYSFATTNAGGGGSHNHSFSGSGSLSSATASINVQYVDVIIATKD